MYTQRKSMKEPSHKKYNEVCFVGERLVLVRCRKHTYAQWSKREGHE